MIHEAKQDTNKLLNNSKEANTRCERPLQQRDKSSRKKNQAEILETQ